MQPVSSLFKIFYDTGYRYSATGGIRIAYDAFILPFPSTSFSLSPFVILNTLML
jgi:hypothetical protein